MYDTYNSVEKQKIIVSTQDQVGSNVLALPPTKVFSICKGLCGSRVHQK